MKFQLYSSTSGWNSRHSAIKTHLGIPTSGITAEYAMRNQIDNESHADHGKYPFPVCTSGTWKCDDQFNANDLVNNDSTWYVSPDFP